MKDTHKIAIWMTAAGLAAQALVLVFHHELRTLAHTATVLSGAIDKIEQCSIQARAQHAKEAKGLTLDLQENAIYRFWWKGPPNKLAEWTRTATRASNACQRNETLTPNTFSDGQDSNQEQVQLGRLEDALAETRWRDRLLRLLGWPTERDRKQAQGQVERLQVVLDAKHQSWQACVRATREVIKTRHQVQADTSILRNQIFKCLSFYLLVVFVGSVLVWVLYKVAQYLGQNRRTYPPAELGIRLLAHLDPTRPRLLSAPRRPPSEHLPPWSQAHLDWVSENKLVFRGLEHHQIFIERMAGKGGEAIVFVVLREPSATYWALKVSLRPSFSEMDREMAVVSKLDAAFCVRPTLVGMTEWNGNKVPFQILPLMKHSLLDEIRATRATGIGNGLKKTWMARLVLCLDSMHRANVLHNDIKADNILVDRTGKLRLADFGLACEIDSLTKRVFGIRAVGTPGFAAPEISEQFLYSPSSDIFALAVTFVEIWTDVQKHPYPDVDHLDDIVRQSPSLNGLGLPEELLELCKAMLRQQPDHRPSLDNIKCHRFFEDIDWNLLV